MSGVEKRHVFRFFFSGSVSMIKKSFLPFPRRQILDSSKLKEFADDNFTFDENGEKKKKTVLEKDRKHCWKRRNCSLRAISPFPTVFSKGLYC